MRVHKATLAAAAGAVVTVLSLMAGALPAAAIPEPAPAPPDPAVATPHGDPVTHEENPRVPEGAAWTQTYFPSSDGSDVELHADVLRPANLPADAKTPVIVSVGPYFSHAGETSPEGFDQVGPSERFRDFVDGAQLMKRGYTFVMVDLRGFGGSTGCLDWVGPGEQADVKAAVEWAASRRWSTGKVGTYGKSYDAVTGLVGNNLKPEGLGAAVAQEPVWDMYNYLFSNKVRRPNAIDTPLSYNSIATMTPMTGDSDRYKANAHYEARHPECLSNNITNNQNPDPASQYWRDRDLASQANGTSTPLFVTQGFIEDNTKPEDAEQYLNNHEGPERGWLGQWEHVRGNETDEKGRLKMGRAGWFDEVMRFYDTHLKDKGSTADAPAYAIEDSLGNWRGQPTWPVVNNSYPVQLSAGEYVDDGGAAQSTSPSTARPPGNMWDMEHAPQIGQLSPEQKRPQRTNAPDSFWTWSKPTADPVRVTGTPKVTLRTANPGNVMVRLWDVAPDGKAVMFDENVARLPENGGQTSIDLKSTDWTLPPGHQLGVQIGTIASDGWLDQPSGQTIEVSRAQLGLELHNPRTDKPTQGDRSPFLDDYLAANTTTLTDPRPGSFPLTLNRDI